MNKTIKIMLALIVVISFTSTSSATDIEEKTSTVIDQNIETEGIITLTEKQVRDNLHFKLGKCTATIMPEYIMTESHKECFEGSKREGKIITFDMGDIKNLKATISTKNYGNYERYYGGKLVLAILSPLNFKYEVPEDKKYEFVSNLAKKITEIPHHTNHFNPEKYSEILDEDIVYYYANDFGYESDSESIHFKFSRSEYGVYFVEHVYILDSSKLSGISRRGSIITYKNDILGVFKRREYGIRFYFAYDGYKYDPK